MDISVVIPVYGCRKALPELYQRLADTLTRITDKYEIIMVDDCCPQGSWADISKLCEKDKKVVGIHLSRNFGQHRAIRAGLDRSCGEWVVIMDCDLQDRPEDIAALRSKALEGYDVVLKRRKVRRETPFTLFFSRLFYKVFNYFTDGSFDGELSNYCIINRRVVEQLYRFNEQNSDYIMLTKWLGFNETVIELEDDARYEGKSSYNFGKKIKLAFELITAYSNKPLFLAIRLGFFISAVAALFLIYVVLCNLIINDYDDGWPSIIGSVYLMGGLIIAVLGIVGVYVGNVFNESKKRPLYAIQEALNYDTDTR